MPTRSSGRTHRPRVLVTGSSGVIGRALTRVLPASGYIPVLFDLRSPDGGEASRSDVRDVRDPRAVFHAVNAVEGVVHLAAVSRAAPAEANPALARATNVDGTRNVLEALRSRRTPAWFLFASSREVYGEPAKLPVPEDHPLRPKGVYGRTKAEGEEVVRAYCDADHRRAAVLRITNLYGDPADYPERVVPAFISAALRGEPLQVHGPSLVLDLLHVDDAVRAILACIHRLRNGVADLGTVNIASGRGISLAELAQRVITATGSASAAEAGPTAAWATSAYVGDIAKAARRLLWRPTIELDAGLGALIRECRAGGTIRV